MALTHLPHPARQIVNILNKLVPFEFQRDLSFSGCLSRELRCVGARVHTQAVLILELLNDTLHFTIPLDL